MLLKILPDKVTRVNAKMRTFLALHFADSASGEERYYPRFVQHFLNAINDASTPNASDVPFRGLKLENGRISSALVQYAHDEASRKFLDQVRQELEHLLPLSHTQLEKLLATFAGQQTPFSISAMSIMLATRLSLPTEDVRAALESMKSLGIFELRPGYESSEWRAGRLFKAALRMKLRR